MNILEKQAQPAPEEELPPEEGAEQEGDEDLDMSDGDPAYAKAKELMLSKLYEEGAADQIAQAMLAAPDPVKGVIDQVMAMLDAMEQATQGAVPDELVIPFVIEVIGEFVEIAQAAKLQIGTAEIAVVVREVMANVVDNLGGDSSAIREEMSKVNPEEIAASIDGEEE